jgi:hypothetical protein
MIVNGYIIKDKIDELKERVVKVKTRLESSNGYFESEGAPKVNPTTIAGEYATILDALCRLSYLQCWYNTRVTTARGDTLHEAIKLQGLYNSMKSSWTTLASATTSYNPYGASVKNKKEDYEYSKFQLDTETCNGVANTYSKNIRDSRAEIRVANAQEIEVPGDNTYWEKIFSV